MNSLRGFSLMEFLISVGLSSLMLATMVVFLSDLQLIVHDLQGVTEQDENLALLPMLLTKWVSGAGNNLSQDASGWIHVTESNLAIRSDTDGPSGFPDGQLSSSYEECWIRQRRRDLQLRSGKGRYQPVAGQVTDLTVGWAHSNLLSIKAESKSRPLLLSQQSCVLDLTVCVYLWNHSSQLGIAK